MIEWKTAKNSSDFRKEHFKGYWAPKDNGITMSLPSGNFKNGDYYRITLSSDDVSSYITPYQYDECGIHYKAYHFFSDDYIVYDGSVKEWKRAKKIADEGDFSDFEIFGCCIATIISVDVDGESINVLDLDDNTLQAIRLPKKTKGDDND